MSDSADLDSYGYPPVWYFIISSSTSRKPYALEEACTVWEGVFLSQKEESTSTDMPLGTAIHNIERTLGKGGQLVRAAGTVAKLIAKEGKSATFKLPSGEVRLISKNCSATVGQVGNVGANQKSLGIPGKPVPKKKATEWNKLASQWGIHPSLPPSERMSGMFFKIDLFQPKTGARSSSSNLWDS
ncbi:50S ribosomal protein L2 [Striga asiatica]|uniref:50S ribosomal protein L2 n=1 Tax=Striga asiatica TaxID=4170 RepID=A0A5A7QR52_STRAF|nr:50S ribosomal protein L2 [Striga asiatica]